MDRSQIVFIVDDDPDIRVSLARSLTIRGLQVRAYASAAEFLDAYEGNEIGCLILDQGMPEMTGLELQEKVMAKGFPLPIIFITGHGGVRESVQAMKAGAVDFLEKPFRQADLMECIHIALEKARNLHTGQKQHSDFKEKLDRLTPREQEIVEHMLSNPSEVSSKEIARQLNISPRTVDNHRARILEKLDIASVVELMYLARTHLEPGG